MGEVDLLNRHKMASDDPMGHSRSWDGPSDLSPIEEEGVPLRCHISPSAKQLPLAGGNS